MEYLSAGLQRHLECRVTQVSSDSLSLQQFIDRHRPSDVAPLGTGTINIDDTGMQSILRNWQSQVHISVERTPGARCNEEMFLPALERSVDRWIERCDPNDPDYRAAIGNIWTWMEDDTQSSSTIEDSQNRDRQIGGGLRLRLPFVEVGAEGGQQTTSAVARQIEDIPPGLTFHRVHLAELNTIDVFQLQADYLVELVGWTSMSVGTSSERRQRDCTGCIRSTGECVTIDQTDNAACSMTIAGGECVACATAEGSRCSDGLCVERCGPGNCDGCCESGGVFRSSRCRPAARLTAEACAAGERGGPCTSCAGGWQCGSSGLCVAADIAATQFRVTLKTVEGWGCGEGAACDLNVFAGRTGTSRSLVATSPDASTFNPGRLLWEATGTAAAQRWSFRVVDADLAFDDFLGECEIAVTETMLRQVMETPNLVLDQRHTCGGKSAITLRIQAL